MFLYSHNMIMFFSNPWFFGHCFCEDNSSSE